MGGRRTVVDVARGRRAPDGADRGAVGGAGEAALTTGTVSPPRSTAEDFAEFVTAHAPALGRLAYLLVADAHAADDLVADVLLAAWKQWDQVSAANHPVAYLRQVMVNQAAARHKRAIRERLGLERLRDVVPHSSPAPDSDAVVDVQAVLRRIPPRRRACLVLRYAFDLSDREVAEMLGVSVGAVKSQTSKAAAQFRRELENGAVRSPQPRKSGDQARPRAERNGHVR